MVNSIFYSWQSDLENRYNRSFIKDCITKAIKNCNQDLINLNYRIDHDTLAATGSPDIISTIFNKIFESDIFIVDISIINYGAAGSTRKVPNPNALIELGYAIDAVGWSNIILIYNLEYGTFEDIPFDIRHRRPLTYKLGPNSSIHEKSETKKNVIKVLTSSFMEMLSVENKFNHHPIAHLYDEYFKNIKALNKSYVKLLESLIQYSDGKIATDFNWLEINEKEIEKIIQRINEKNINESLDSIKESNEIVLNFFNDDFPHDISKVSHISAWTYYSMNKFINEVRASIRELTKIKDGVEPKFYYFLVRIQNMVKNQNLVYVMNYEFYHGQENTSIEEEIVEISEISCSKLIVIIKMVVIMFKRDYKKHQNYYLKNSNLYPGMNEEYFNEL
ncbi:hypothetical protein CEQ90_19240 [Lewinellaceae bacterium SD302]|nr:hypothetical protein CEQ90_19240 [Lewinellaceae bacterium SD302]